MCAIAIADRCILSAVFGPKNKLLTSATWPLLNLDIEMPPVHATSSFHSIISCRIEIELHIAERVFFSKFRSWWILSNHETLFDFVFNFVTCPALDKYTFTRLLLDHSGHLFNDWEKCCRPKSCSRSPIARAFTNAPNHTISNNDPFDLSHSIYFNDVRIG